MKRFDALRAAEEANLDLLCVAPMAKPPVCKILNYGKYRFEKQKKAKEIKKNQKVVEVKEARLTPQIDLHDLETKAKVVRVDKNVSSFSSPIPIKHAKTIIKKL